MNNGQYMNDEWDDHKHLKNLPLAYTSQCVVNINKILSSNAQ